MAKEDALILAKANKSTIAANAKTAATKEDAPWDIPIPGGSEEMEDVDETMNVRDFQVSPNEFFDKVVKPKQTNKLQTTKTSVKSPQMQKSRTS